MLTRWCSMLFLKQNIYFPTPVLKDQHLLIFKQKGCFLERGRASFLISKEHLEFFLAYGFHCPGIGQILGVSAKEVKPTKNFFQVTVNSLGQLWDLRTSILVSCKKQASASQEVLKAHLRNTWTLLESFVFLNQILLVRRLHALHTCPILRSDLTSRCLTFQALRMCTKLQWKTSASCIVR